MTNLHVRYRRLMFAYPREYRRHRGAEIADTYIEMAAEGQRWPRGRDAVSLLRHGLRARLGRPRSRLVLPLTILAMLVGGLSAAAAGARAAWGASTALTTRQTAEAAQLMPPAWRSELPTTDDSRPAVPAWFAGYLSMPVSNFPLAVVHPAAADRARGWAGQQIHDLVDLERARLVGAGWTVTSQTATDDQATLTVRRGDVAERVTIGPNGYIASASREQPATVAMFMVLGALLGAVLTYLLFGWVGRRSGRLAPASQRVVMAGLTLTTALAAPAGVVCGVGIWAALHDHSDVPLRYWGGFATGDLRIAAMAAAVLLVATIAAVALARPAQSATPVAQ